MLCELHAVDAFGEKGVLADQKRYVRGGEGGGEEIMSPHAVRSFKVVAGDY